LIFSQHISVSLKLREFYHGKTGGGGREKENRDIAQKLELDAREEHFICKKN